MEAVERILRVKDVVSRVGLSKSSVYAKAKNPDDVWPTEPGMDRVADGVANWKHRIFALGNGQVPRVHATAWRILAGG